MDTGTPTSKMILTGAVADLERSPIAERVREGCYNAPDKAAGWGVQAFRPKAAEFAALRRFAA